jgi:hypothetical protein
MFHVLKKRPVRSDKRCMNRLDSLFSLLSEIPEILRAKFGVSRKFLLLNLMEEGMGIRLICWALPWMDDASMKSKKSRNFIFRYGS